jgi:hypothetical protein
MFKLPEGITYQIFISSVPKFSHSDHSVTPWIGITRPDFPYNIEFRAENFQLSQAWQQVREMVVKASESNFGSQTWLENGHWTVVDLPIKDRMVDLSSSLCKRWPGRVVKHTACWMGSIHEHPMSWCDFFETHRGFEKRKPWIDRGCLPSGNDWHSYGKLPFIVSFPIKNGDFP